MHSSQKTAEWPTSQLSCTNTQTWMPRAHPLHPSPILVPTLLLGPDSHTGVPHQSIRECMSDLPASWTTTTLCIPFPQDPLYHLLPPISSCSPGQPFPTTVTDSIDSGILQISQIKRWVTCLPVELPTTQMLNPRAHPMVIPLSNHPSSFIGGQPGSRDHRKTPTQGC